MTTPSNSSAATAARFEELKRYVRFTEADAEVLATLRDHVRPHFADIAREFYERSREHEEAHAVFEGEEQIARLQASLVRWMERVMTGPYDAAYADKSAQIGRVHVHVALPQRFMFAAMSLVRVRLVELAERKMGDEAPAACRALSRILDIELAMMNETYIEDLVDRARTLERAQTAGHDRAHVRAVELASALIVGLDGEGRIRLFNPEAERVTRRRSSDVGGLPFTELLAEEDRQSFDDMVKWLRGRPRGGEAPFELELRTRSGRRRKLAGCMRNAPVEDDAEVAFILAGRDVTEERMLAERLRRSESLAAVGTLAAGLAHEIRNPLNGAQLHLTFLQRALRDGDNPELLEAAQVVAGEIHRLSALVTEFLDFARPSELRPEPVSISELCRKAGAMVITGDRSAKLRIDVPQSELVADVDPGKIEQVLLNLLHNALEAVEDSGGEVTLRAYREPRHAVIEVWDDGPGLPSPEAPIFDAFYSTKPGGTGLGLAIAHRIVTRHDGMIAAESKPGRTVFRVRLPLRSAAHELSTPPPASVEEPST